MWWLITGPRPPASPTGQDNRLSIAAATNLTYNETQKIVLEEGEEIIPILLNVEALLYQKEEGRFERLVSIALDYRDTQNDQVAREQKLLFKL